jgi:hypothetical protein
MTHRALFLLLTVALALVIIETGVDVLAQTTGEITGTILDSRGSVLAGATVWAHNDDTGEDQNKVMTDSSGIYVVPLLQAGTYDVTVEKTGFATVVKKGSPYVPERASE